MLSALQAVMQMTPSLKLGSPRCGWIGIDLGGQVIKLAQIRRGRGSWQWVGRWSIGDESSEPLTSELLNAGALAEKVSALCETRRLFRGRLAAATLPSEMVELRPLELPTGPWHEMCAMVEQELAADAPAAQGRYEFDAWEAIRSENLTQVIAAVAERDATVRAADGLLAAGFQCAVVDAIPCALARAVELCDPAAQAETVLTLDMGYTSALLSVVHEGRPVLCRRLRGCGQQAIMQLLQEKLGVDPLECRQLLVRYGLPAAESCITSAATSIQRIIGRMLDHLADEVRRTAQFATYQLRLTPKRMWLFGGGATIRNCAHFLGQETGVPTANWNLAGTECPSDAVEPLFGIAAGLSALAWEDRKWE